MTSRIIVARTAAAAALALAATTVGATPAAHAATTLVASPGGSGTACTTAAPCALTQAVTSSATGDSIALIAGTYALADTLTITKGVTVAPLATGVRPVLQFDGGDYLNLAHSGAVVSGLRIEATDLGPVSWGVRLQPGTGQGLEVVTNGVANAFGVLLSDGASLTDSSVWSRADSGIALTTGEGGSALVRNVTAIATGPGSTGLFTNPSYASPGNTTITVQNSILRGAAYDVDVYSGDPAKVITLGLDHSNYVTSGAPSPHAHLNDLGGRQTTAPSFVDAAAGNFRQTSFSSTRDAGAAVPALSATALDGQQRVIGSAPDIGADEYVAAPVVSVVTVAKVKVKNNGRAVLRLVLPTAGSVGLVGRGVKSVAASGGVDGIVKLKVKPTKAGLRKLRAKGRLKTHVALLWAPTAGTPGTQPSIPLTLKLKRKR